MEGLKVVGSVTNDSHASWYCGLTLEAALVKSCSDYWTLAPFLNVSDGSCHDGDITSYYHWLQPAAEMSVDPMEVYFFCMGNIYGLVRDLFIGASSSLAGGLQLQRTQVYFQSW